MAQFQAFDDGVEVNGQTVCAVVDAMPDVFEDNARRFLAANGIDDPTPGEWYSQQAWLDTFEAVYQEVGEATLRQIGKSIPRNADWPPGADSIVDGVASIDEAYHMNHRGGEIGYYRAEKVGERTISVRCRTPYACAFDHGIVAATADQFAGEKLPRVTEVGDHCRVDGSQECVYEVSWLGF